jgi:hypothetical protein
MINDPKNKKVKTWKTLILKFEITNNRKRILIGLSTV